MALVRSRSGRSTLSGTSTSSDVRSPTSPGPEGLQDLETTMLPMVGELRAAATELDVKIAALVLDIGAAGGNLASQLQQLKDAFQAWKNSWFSSYFFNSWRVRDELLVWRRRFNEILESWNKVAPGQGNISTVNAFDKRALTKYRPDDPTFLGQLEKIAKYTMVLGVVVGGAYALGKVSGIVKDVRGVR